MDAQLLDQLNQTINVATPTTASASGDPTYGSATAIAARVEDNRQIVQAADGSFRETTHWIATQTAITDETRIWLPGDSPADPKLARLPAQVNVAVAENGSIDHYEVRV